MISNENVLKAFQLYMKKYVGADSKVEEGNFIKCVKEVIGKK